MKKISVVIISLVTVLFSVSLIMAAEPENRGPKTINLKMGKSMITFTHHKHQKITNNQCWECHDKSKGKIDKWGESTAHKLCIPCHDLNEKGPVKCKACHKK